jgi:CMP-N-acetylneuraminic acid synthetase
MRTVASIPVKRRSTRVPGKNLRPFAAGPPLYAHFFDKLEGLPFDEIVVDTDDAAIAADAQRRGWRHLPRAPELAEDAATGNELLIDTAQRVEADLYFQLFVTAPLLRPETIRHAHDLLVADDEHDSIFTALAMHSWFWFDGAPVNYDPRKLVPSQESIPVVRETTGLYGIRRDILLADRCRIGRRPHMLFVDDVEAADIDTELDFRIAELLWQEQERSR